MTTAVAPKRVEIREILRGRLLREQSPPATLASGAKVYKVILLAEGPGNPRDKHFYTARSIQKAPTIFESLPAFADHPDAIEEEARPERSVKDMIGWYEHVEATPDEKSGKGILKADLVVSPGPSFQWVRDLLDAAIMKKQRDPTGPDLIGLSINATGITEPMDVGGEEWNAVTEFVEAKSVDIVTQAGAGGRILARALKEGMRQSVREGKMQAIQVKQAVEDLRALNRPRLQPIIDQLDKVYLDLTHETPGGEEMATAAEKEKAAKEAERQRIAAKAVEAKAKAAEDEGSHASEDEAMATELETRVRQAVAAEFERRETEAHDEPDGDEPDADEAEGVSFKDWAQGDQPPADEPDGDEPSHEARLRAIEKKLGIADLGAEGVEAAEGVEDGGEAAEVEGVEDQAETVEEFPALLKKNKQHEAAADADNGKAKGKEKPEAALRVSPALRESVARSLYRKALEGTKKPTEREKKLARENAMLRAEIAEVKELQECREVLSSIGVPRDAWQFLIEDMIGRPRKDKVRFVESYRAAILSRHRVREAGDDDFGQHPTDRSRGSARDADMTGSLGDFDVPILSAREVQ